MSYRLVPATEDDKQWFDDLRRSVYQDLFVATWGGWDEERHQRHFTACWERGDLCAVELDGVRIGMIQLFERADSVEIGEIQIQPSHQGRGLGSEILLDTISRAHAQGKSVRLSTGLKNEGAVALYRRLGFVDTEQTDTHYHLECRPNQEGM